MIFMTAAHTDTGPCRETNEDSLIVMRARTGGGEILLAGVCDGMGGLEKGEAASAALVFMLQDWFSRCLPALLRDGLGQELLRTEWRRLAAEADRRIMEHGKRKGIELGTTCAALLLAGDLFFLMNIGDSRIYRITGEAEQLTRDQTRAQMEFEQGLLTADQARRDPGRNLLLQCIGTGPAPEPDFLCGRTEPGQVFLLCSDGFSHELPDSELAAELSLEKLTDEAVMEERLRRLTDLCVARGETDNLSAVLIRICADARPVPQGE